MEQSDKPTPRDSIEFKREISDIRRTAGARLKEAREMCELKLEQARKRLHLNNAQDLRKIETGLFTGEELPLWLVVRAAKAYEVSTDWILGVTDDWEVDARLTERDTGLFLIEEIERGRMRDLKEMAKLHRQLMIIGDQTRTLAKSVLNWVFRWENRELDKLEDVHFEMLKDEFAELADIASKARASMDKLKIPEIMDILPHGTTGTASTNAS